MRKDKTALSFFIVISTVLIFSSCAEQADLIVTDILFKEDVCFPAGTEVLTASEPRAIETIESGTEVYTYDLAKGE